MKKRKTQKRGTKRPGTVPVDEVFEHKRVKKVKSSANRRGSIVTSTPTEPGAKRRSVGFVLTPSPGLSGASYSSMTALPFVNMPVSR